MLLSRTTGSAWLANALHLGLLSIGANGQDCDHRSFQKISDPNGSVLWGRTLALDGPYAIVGDPLDSDIATSAGAFYLYEKIGGVYTEIQKVAPPSLEDFDLLGGAAAIDGDRCIASAMGDDNYRGRVYVFQRNAGGTLDHLQALVASDRDPTAFYGLSLDIDGEVIVVGAYRRNGTGSAYVYRWDGAAFQEEAILEPSGLTVGDDLGWSCAVAGDRIVLGAPSSDLFLPDGGAAYVYEYEQGSWVLEQELPPFGAFVGEGSGFGSTVAMEAEWIVVGAPNQVVQGGGDGGAAYVFRWTGADPDPWIGFQEIRSPEGAKNTNFGNAVGLEDHRLVVGAPGWDSPDLVDAGAIHSYRFTGDEFRYAERLIGVDSMKYLGKVVAMGGRVVVGEQDPPNTVSFYKVPDLVLDFPDHTVPLGGVAEFWSTGGVPGTLSLTYLLFVDNIPVVYRAFASNYQASGGWITTLTIPNDPALANLELGLEVFGFRYDGKLTVSNLENLTLQ